MPARKFAVYTLAGLIALAIGVWAAKAHYIPDRRQTHAPEQLWAMQLPDSYGKPQSLSQWRGKILVLNFWATWCAPCRDEIPDLLATRSEYAGKRLELVGIAIDNPQLVKEYMRDMRIAYPILIGQGEALAMARALGNPSGALPYTVVISPDGNLLMRHLGRLPKAKLQAILDQSLNPANVPEPHK